LQGLHFDPVAGEATQSRKSTVNSETDRKGVSFMKGAAMEKTVKREKDEKAIGIKKPYLTPSLCCYGTLKELTRGGTVARNENVGHPEGRL